MPQSIAETCVPRSILDSDLYKVCHILSTAISIHCGYLNSFAQFTMQCAVLRNFPNVVASYKLTIRDKSLRFTKDAVDIFRDAISCKHITWSYHAFSATYTPFRSDLEPCADA